MKENNYIIRLESDRLGYGKVVLSNPDHISIPRGITIVYGENGSGKTTFGTIIEKGRYAYGNRISFSDGIEKVKMLSFTDIHSLSGMEAHYYVQRLEATMNDMVPTVGMIMGDKVCNPLWIGLCETFDLQNIIDKRINFLSSGELRKLLLINAMFDNPDILVIDNPYIGLDPMSRLEFDEAVKKLSSTGKSVIMLICDHNEIPEFTDSLIILDNLLISDVIRDKSLIRSFREREADRFVPDIRIPEFENILIPHDITFSINHGHVKYGTKEIFSDFNWTVRKGEKWLLKGPNGSGKSMLLSLICADNPQGYSNDIVLFDRKRGSGESIWEIKDAIGYVSPEMHLYFKSNSIVEEIVIQGMRNTLGRYRPISDIERGMAMRWLDIFGISHLADRKFNDLSTGEQRLVLVARAMIKQPALLVLDEPLHGLDAVRKKIVNRTVDLMTEKNDTSLIYVTHYESEIPSCVRHIKNMR